MISTVKDVIVNRIQRRFNLPSKPDYVSVSVTWECNSRCSTCGIWNAPHSNKEMTLEDYERLLTDPLLSRLKVWEMTGGEPMLYKDIFGVTELAFKHVPHAEVRIGTNCIAANRLMQLITAFKKKPLYLSLSIDGVGEKHDEIRGVKGNFNQVIRVIDHIRDLQGHGSSISFGASVCVSKLNVKHVPVLVRWLERNKIPFQLTPVIFPPYARIEYAREKKEDLDFISNTERNEAIGIFSRYEKSTYRIFCLYWAKMQYPIPACYALRKYCHVRPNGDVEVCMWKPIIVGNLTKNTLSEIWNGNVANKVRRLIKNCTECAYVHPNLCDALNNYHFHGTFVKRRIRNIFVATENELFKQRRRNES